MNKKQAKLALKLANSVAKSTDYIQNNSFKCAGAHLDKILNPKHLRGNFWHISLSFAKELLGLSEKQYNRVFAASRKNITARRKATEIRAIVRAKYPELINKK